MGGFMKPTIQNLAKHLDRTDGMLYKMQKQRPKQFEILWLGWVHYCLQKGMK